MRRRTLALAVALPAALASTLLIAPAAHAADADIRINEVQSNSATGAPDFIELTNVGTAAVDISNWVVRDNKDDSMLRVAGGTVVAPGAFVVIEPDVPGGFGLGKDDMARIYAADGTTLVDSYAWTEHAFSEGRLPDGTGDFVDTEPTPGAANIAREAVVVEPVDSPVVVNELQSDDPDGGPDWVELLNTGAEPVDVSGWILRDDDDLSELRIPAGTVLAPGAFLVVETKTADARSFSLGKADKIRVYTADGVGLVDEYAWTEHAFTEGRLPDGTGDFVDTEPTPGAANVARFAASPIVINEVESNGDARGDWVELANTDTVNTVDLSGWTLIDNDPSHAPIVLPEGTTIESGGYRGIVTDASFGLGGADSITLRNPVGEVVDTYAWESHAATTYGRCPDMTGPFTTTNAGTFELVNDCAVVEEPVVDTEPWPYGDEVRDAVAPGTWGEDMSGLDFDASGTLWAVNNDNAEIFRLAEGADGMFTIADSWVPRYPDGSGQPDAEGITIAGDGAIFLSTERDNLAKSVSRPSILRVVVDGTGATTTHEWNLAEALGPLGANAGIEGIEWISDADATRLGVLDASGAANGAVAVPYDPSLHDAHFGGIFAIAVEQTGEVLLVVLGEDGWVRVMQRTTAGVDVAMGLDWQAGGNLLWAMCDEACENRLGTLQVVEGLLTAVSVHDPAAGMNRSFTNEGLALRWCAPGETGLPDVAWISDTAHDGVSLRLADGTCQAAAPEPTTDAPTPTPTDAEPTRTPVAGVGAAPGGASGAGSLPRTGGEAPWTIGALGLLLLLAGAGLALRRRQRA